MIMDKGLGVGDDTIENVEAVFKACRYKVFKEMCNPPKLTDLIGLATKEKLPRDSKKRSVEKDDQNVSPPITKNKEER